MRLLSSLICALFLSAIALEAQNPAFKISRYEELIVAFPGAVDDIIVTPQGRIFVSLTSQQAIGEVFPGQANPFVAIRLNITALSLEYGPDNKLYFGDALDGTIRRIDIATGVEELVASGFFVPIDIAFDVAGNLFVVDQSTSDFINGDNFIWKIVLDAMGQEVSRNLVGPSLIGAADVVIAPDDTVFAASLGTIDLFSFNQTTGIGASVFNGIPLPSDIVDLQNDTLAVSSLYSGILAVVDVNTGGLLELSHSIGGDSTIGAEDIAIIDGNDLLVTMTDGTIFRLDRSSSLRQISDSEPGLTMEIKVDRPTLSGYEYLFGMSYTANLGIPIDAMRVIPLDPDEFLEFTTSQPAPIGLESFRGFLDGMGQATISFEIPPFPFLSGLNFYGAAILFPSLSAPVSQWDLTNAAEIRIR